MFTDKIFKNPELVEDEMFMCLVINSRMQDEILTTYLTKALANVVLLADELQILNNMPVRNIEKINEKVKSLKDIQLNADKVAKALVGKTANDFLVSMGVRNNVFA